MLKIGTIYRTAQSPNFKDPVVDGYQNYYFETNLNDEYSFAPRRGINTISPITGSDGIQRTPVYILHISHKNSGANYNPWHDEIDSNNGIIKYFGDNKPDVKNPNNKYLVEQFHYNCHSSKSVRELNSVPIICLENVKSGYNRFLGFGIIESAELITQYYDLYDTYIPNYLFRICIFSIAEENEEFNWQWINDRCNPKLSIKEANRNAPSSWKKWINQGMPKIHTIRRKVLSGKVIPDDLQRPKSKSDLDILLKDIYSYYAGRKSDFEALAMEVTKLVIEENGGKCTPGWLTPTSGDGGYDFVLKTTLGTTDLARLQIIMLGQAKCEVLTGHVNGKDIARLIARLKRGWVGSFVTTQTFSVPLQQEILDDNYPLLLINGLKVAEIVQKELKLSEYKTLSDYLDSITKLYQRKSINPESILD